jgi:antitoxin YefM
VAVILGADDFDALLETVEILADTEAMQSIRQGLAELAAGALANSDDVRAEMQRAGRLRK